MARKRKPESSGPSDAYLVSFGDTMTALLAFFIVLNAFAQEQTGANLHTGTGSFSQAVQGLGLPGMFSQRRSEHAFQYMEPSPAYPVDDPQDRPLDTRSIGPHEESNSLRVIDSEKEEFERFLNEIEHMYKKDEFPATDGQVVFDTFKSFNPKEGLPTDLDELLQQTLPMLARPNYEIDIILWTPTPSETAWTRTVGKTAALQNSIQQKMRLKPDQTSRLSTMARPWMFSDERRPVSSIIVRRVDG